MPEFAVLTPTLPERKSLLEECKASVSAQTIACTHLIGVDSDREGPGVVRNQLAASSDADWFLPVDDDDLIDPDLLEVLSQHLDEADVIYPWCRVEGLDEWTPNRLFRPDPLLTFNYIPVTALVRAELWRDVGGMRDEPFEDWRLWQRCLGAGARFKCVDEVLWTYRIQAGTRNQWETASPSTARPAAT
jgi:glycosyltransferase involved in cell wall biosynthesis